LSIEEYLAILQRNLRARPFARRRILREIEAHLLDAVGRERSGGTSREEAEQRAIARFGPAEGLAARLSEPSEARRRRKAALMVAVGASAVGVALGLGLSRATHRAGIPLPPGVTISGGRTMVRVVPGGKALVTRDSRFMAFDHAGRHVRSVEAFLNEVRKHGRHVAFVKEGSKVWLVSRRNSLFFFSG